MGDKEHDTTSSSATAKTRTEVRRRTISPYDLTAGDNPGTIISKPALRGPNYDEWSASIYLALKARKKFGFADGSISQLISCIFTLFYPFINENFHHID